MATRSIATLSLTFGLVSIPVKVYLATESSAAIQFKLMGRGGSRLRQQYVADHPVEEPELDDLDHDEPRPSGPGAAAEPEAAGSEGPGGGRSGRAASLARAAATAPPPASLPAPARATASPPGRVEREPEAVAKPSAVVERGDMVKGYEFEKGRFVLFTPAELKALQERSRQTIDIVAFIPAGAVDPIYYDKAYFLAPDLRGAKPYSLLLAAMRRSGRCALAKWAWRSKEYVVQIRPGDGGLVLQQLLYADEVRSLHDLRIELVPVSDAEIDLALRLIDQISEESYDPGRFVDEEKQRILAAIEEKVAGKRIVAPPEPAEAVAGGQVIDLMAALRASLATGAPGRSSAARKSTKPETAPGLAGKERKGPRRAAKTEQTPARAHPSGKAKSR